MEQDVIELKQNSPDGKYIIKKLPGRSKAGEVTLTRGADRDKSFEKWVKDSQFGKMGDVRKGGAIIVYDYEGNGGQAVQADQRLAEEPGDRLAEGRRHQRAHREAGRHLRAARGRVMRRSAADRGAGRVRARADAGRGAPAGAAGTGTAHRVQLRAAARLRRRGRARVHRDGVMRLATARDELVPLRDDRVRENPAYLTVVLLGRVITRIGTIDDVHAGIVENLFASDLAFLQDLYRRINQEGHTRAAVTCPECEHRVRRRPRRWAPGGIVTYAPDRLYEEVAYVAYHFHWSLDDMLDLEHRERQRFVAEIADINTRISQGR